MIFLVIRGQALCWPVYRTTVFPQLPRKTLQALLPCLRVSSATRHYRARIVAMLPAP
jgi:hypothetical protein